MKINSIYINAFGGLKKLSIDFSDGFNVIYGGNEDGKTTVMEFIKCMFYGTGGKKQNLNESIREKYTPWDSSVMGGRIYFTKDGNEYCLEREFRKSDSTDRISLINKDTGEEIPTGANVGEKIFGLNAKAFERSVFIDNEVAFSGDTSAEADLNARLSSVGSTGDGDVSEEKVLKRITTARNAVLSVSGKAGTLAADKAEREELCRSLSGFEEQARRKSEIAEKTEALEAKLLTLQKAFDETKKVADSEFFAKNIQKLKDYLALKGELSKLSSDITTKDGTHLNSGFLNALKYGLENYEKHALKADSLSEDIELAEKQLKEIENDTPEDAQRKYEEAEGKIKALEAQRNLLVDKINQKNEETENAEAELKYLSEKKSVLNIPLFIFAVLAAVISFVFGFVLKSLIPCAAFAAAGLVLLILSFVIKPASKKKALAEQRFSSLKSELEDLKEQKAAVSEEKANALSRLSLMASSATAQRALAEQRAADIKTKKELLDVELAAKKKAEDEVIKYFGKYKDVNSVDEIKLQMNKFAEIAEKQKEIKTKLTVISKDLNNISYEEAKQKLNALSSKCDTDDVDFDLQKQRLEALNRDITHIKEEISSLNTELITGFRGFISPETVKRQIAEIDEKIKAKEEFCAAADLAAEMINQSAQTMRKEYGSTLESETLKIFSGLTSGKYTSLNVMKGFDIKTESADTFGMHDIDYMSKGTVGGAYLSLRLAIASLLSKDDALPVLLDDSLSQFDDNRQKNAISFLSEYAGKTQVMLFTCHGNIKQSAESIGAKVITPFAD